jgi:hypothetical protein
MFSVEGPTVLPPTNGNGHSSDPELERLRLVIQEQQVRMEADRQTAMQRSHEMQMALIQSLQNHSGGAAPQMTIADMVAAVKNLNDMGGQDQIDKAIDRVFNLAGKVQQLTNPGASTEDEGWWGWTKPVLQEAGKQLLPKVIPFLNNAPPPMPPGPTVQPTPPAVPQIQENASVSPQQPNGEIDQEALYLAQKREALAFALAMARLNRSPEMWADMAVEQVETSNNPVTARFLAECMKAENFNAWFADLEKLEPTVITQRGWFESFFQAVRDVLNAKAGEMPDSES